ncbi:hypothetical protein HELRODRAFT_160665 [Helobdella robusta]|uniref:Coiled-coil domain-containing protein 12 n=1 Tax=Helobdella robusta TaxID=6412 RepID=T1EQK7_HELRO|nr:hypothetical protein HELRODRAFT_160665 [Helobdella robusta]ESO06490.1 hypothetical protein HELRODRAFT_160665 [Helobdella robusta]
MTSLQEEAQKRRERLKNLRERKDKLENDESDEKKAKMDDDVCQALPKPVFRSYQPTDEKLKEGVLEPAKPLEIKEQVKDQLIDAQQTNIVEEVDLLNLAPRKPDWDLKRDVAKKLEKLERRTQRAMGELIRDRLKSCEMKSEEVAASLYLTT